MVTKFNHKNIYYDLYKECCDNSFFKGRCWSKNGFAHFSTHSFHCTFIMISMNKSGENFFSRAWFPWNSENARRRGGESG